MPRPIAAQIATRRMEARALELRSQGETYDEIASELGFANRGGAYKAVQRALLATVRPAADELRTLELERLEEAFRAVWPKAVDTSHPQQLRAVDTLLSVMDRMDRLTGLDQPRRRGSKAEPKAPPKPGTPVLVIAPHR